MKLLFITFLFFTNFALARDSVYYQSFFTINSSGANPKQVIIRDSIFSNKGNNLIYGQLKNLVYINNVCFKGIKTDVTIQLYCSTFYKDADFSNSKFDNYTDFSGCTFKRDITLSRDTFNKIIFLSDLHTDSLTAFNFYGAVLPDLIDFSHNKLLYGVVDFTDAVFDGPVRENGFFSPDTRHFINIYDSDINKIKLDYLHFKLCFYDPRSADKIVTGNFKNLLKNNTIISDTKGHTDTSINYENVYRALIKAGYFKDYINTIFPKTDMDSPVVKNFTEFYVKRGTEFPAKLSPDQIEAVYSRLLNNFAANGQKMSYEAADIDRNNFVHSYYYLPYFWNCYGYHKALIFLWTAFFLTLFTIINYVLYESLLERNNRNDIPYDIGDIPKITKYDRRPVLRKWKYSFIYTSLIFFSFSMKLDKLNLRRNMCLYVITINVIGLLCLGYLANFILQK